MRPQGRAGLPGFGNCVCASGNLPAQAGGPVALIGDPRAFSEAKSQLVQSGGACPSPRLRPQAEAQAPLVSLLRTPLQYSWLLLQTPPAAPTAEVQDPRWPDSQERNVQVQKEEQMDQSPPGCRCSRDTPGAGG